MKLFGKILVLILATLAVFEVGAEDKRPTIDAISNVLLEQQSWLNNDIGITDKIPAPWEPIRIQKNGRDSFTVITLGREYKFDKSFLPSTIITWGNQILSDISDIRVVLSNGKERVFKVDGIKIVKSSPTEVQLVSFGSVEGINLFFSTRIEYDGMIWTDITITPDSTSVEVEKLFLDIPIKNAYAKYITTNLGLLTQPLPVNFEFKNDIWFGDENVGLSWFAESDQGWDRSGKLDHQMEIFEHQNSTVLRLNIISSPRSIESSRQMSFGILATPTKQLKKNWHASKPLFKPDFADFNWDWGSYYPEPKPDLITSGDLSMYIKSDGYFKTGCNYFAATFRDGTVVPEYFLFGRIWESFGPAEKAKLTNPRLPEVSWSNKYTDLNILTGNANTSKADWLLWKWNNLVDKYGIKRIYFDSLGAPDINRLHGSGYLDENGEVRPTVPILAMRKFLQRFYVMMSDKMDDFTLMLHGASSIPPVLSFAHAHLSGEQFIVPPRRIETHYSDIVPMEEWRGFFSGKQLGVVGTFLPEFTPRNAAFEEPTQEMIMLTLIHDIPIVSAFCSQGTVKKIQNIMYDYGMDNMEFVPYWYNHDYLECSDENVKVSFYKDAMTGNRAILLIGNLNSSHKDIKIAIKKNLISGENLKIEDLLNKETFELKNNSFDLVVKELNFRLISVSTD